MSRQTLGEDLELDVGTRRCPVLFVSSAGAVSKDAVCDFFFLAVLVQFLLDALASVKAVGSRGVFRHYCAVSRQ